MCTMLMLTTASTTPTGHSEAEIGALEPPAPNAVPSRTGAALGDSSVPLGTDPWYL